VATSDYATLERRVAILESPSGMGETPRLQAKPSGGPKGPGFFPWLYRARRAFVGFSRRGAQNPSASGEGDSKTALCQGAGRAGDAGFDEVVKY
jgi:hypothetical protein